MDVNERLKGLERITGIQVFPDESPAEREKSISFVYEDERPILHGDDRPVADTVYIQLTLYTPSKLNYMDLKHRIRDYLEDEGFCVTSIQSWIDAGLTGTKRTRHTVFEINYTEPRERGGYKSWHIMD